MTTADRRPVPASPLDPVADAGAPDDVRRVSVLLGLLFGLAGMGSAAASLALAPLAEAYDVPLGAAAWSISLYALMLGVGTAVYGRFADLSGPRTPLLIGLTLMSVGAVTAALAPTFAVHLVGRLFQGAGAAAVPTLGAAIISHRYTGAAKTGALLRVAAIASAVTCLGPLSAGVLVDTLGWRVAIALPVLGTLLVPALWSALHVGGSGARLDVLGAVLTVLTAGGVVLVLQSPSTGAAVALAGVLLVLLGAPISAARVRRVPHGFLPRAVVTDPVVVRSAIAAAAVPASWFALLVAIPALLLRLGWEPWQVGLGLVPAGVLGLFMPRFVGPLMARVSSRTALRGSAATSVVALSVAALGAAAEWPVVLLGSVALVTIAFGVGQPALSAAVGGAVDDDVRGVALGVATLVFMVGGSVGSATVGGLGEVVGLGESLALLLPLPLLGLLLLARPDPREARPVG
ncbi:MFS transporter [Nocardioides sp.]|uniref:MFS transporter n=1 Tax=Nocardioides sp. TaxID=35761 RepID=UPI0035146B09